MQLMNDMMPRIVVSPRVEQKMQFLVQMSDKEIAWHGYVERVGNTFYWFDIILYPQYVTGVTVNPDETEYANWILQQMEYKNGENFNKLRLHGHSHVNMAVTPSGTDMQYRRDMLKNLGKDDFYIFMIANKKDQFTLELYDNVTGIIYDEDDVEYIVGDEEEIKRNKDWAKQVISTMVKEEKVKCSTTSKAQNSSTQKTSNTRYTSLDAERWEDSWPSRWFDSGYQE